MFSLCSPLFILTRSPQISGQNKSEAREPEGLVIITCDFVTKSLFKRAGNSNEEIFLNCGSKQIATVLKARPPREGRVT